MNVIELVKSMPTNEQRGAIKALDACTRPLTVREVELALRRVGLPVSRAVKIAAALRKIAIIAVTLDGGK